MLAVRWQAVFSSLRSRLLIKEGPSAIRFPQLPSRLTIRCLLTNYHLIARYKNRSSLPTPPMKSIVQIVLLVGISAGIVAGATPLPRVSERVAAACRSILPHADRGTMHVPSSLQVLSLELTSMLPMLFKPITTPYAATNAVHHVVVAACNQYGISRLRCKGEQLSMEIYRITLQMPGLTPLHRLRLDRNSLPKLRTFRPGFLDTTGLLYLSLQRMCYHQVQCSGPMSSHLLCTSRSFVPCILVPSVIQSMR